MDKKLLEYASPRQAEILEAYWANDNSSTKAEAKKLIQFHCYDYIETVMNKPYSYRSDQLTCSDMYNYCIKSILLLLPLIN